LGVVRTDIDDHIHQQMHQTSENDSQYQCERCHSTPATLNNHCFNMLWRTPLHQNSSKNSCVGLVGADG
jgi:hypothetical protein